jgi:hypothetical protein
MKCVTVEPRQVAGDLNFYNVYIKVFAVTPLQNVEVSIVKYLDPQSNSYVDVCSVAYLSNLCNSISVTDSNGIASFCLIKGSYLVKLMYQGYTSYTYITVSKNQTIEIPFYLQ